MTGSVAGGAAGADELAVVIDEATLLSDYPRAVEVLDGVLLYDAAAWNGCEGEARADLMRELAQALADGPGVLVLKGAYRDTSVIDAATEVFDAIIAAERAAGQAAGDHFGRPGANARVWNAQQKLALTAPEVFAEYFACDAIALACEAWLGPGYQVTSQVNLVYPGGAAQEPHPDYHLGFLGDEAASRYPMHVHAMSPFLTLQGAVAHVDMPVASGTTMLLPHSQKFTHGYLSYRRPDIRALFADRMVQLPLDKGDVLFFSPALLHGAGTNRTADVQRMANLLQISSAFGRAMETVDRLAMCEAVYPVLLERADSWSAQSIANVIAACAEGYAFPTNLDHDQPIGGLAPASQADLVRAGLDQRQDPAMLTESLIAAVRRRDS